MPTEQAAARFTPDWIDLIWADIQAVRDQGPLVHNITNFVVMNISANVLLAAGASPVMAHAPEEVADMVKIAGALVVNIGTLEPAWINSMATAMRTAQALGKPIVLDPVGAGATPYRNHALSTLLAAATPQVIRGNGSEMMALAGSTSATKGVDSSTASDAALAVGQEMARRYSNVIGISGAVDYVMEGSADGRLARLANGDPMMTRLTGTGCSASALIGAFCAVQRDYFRATVSALCLTAVAGEIAARQVRQEGRGVGSFQARWLDQLETLTADALRRTLRGEIVTA